MENKIKFRKGYTFDDVLLVPQKSKVLPKETNLKTRLTNNIKLNMKVMKFINNWYPIILAFICMLYSIGLGLAGHTAEAQYSAHWPGTILLFALAIRQRRKS